MSQPTILQRLALLKDYFDTGNTKPANFRIEQLKKLRKSLLLNEKEIYAALYQDLKKSAEESWVTELGFTLSEIRNVINNLRRWMQPERVSTNLLNLPSGSRIFKEPLGIVLIIAPWNYPFQLLINPLVGAIAAGNCVVLKPSEFAPATSAIMKKIVEETFSPEYVYYVEGDGAEQIPAMMNHFSFDHVFYTGSTSVGKIIYKMAAERLVPVTLELGGKSPGVVEKDANIAVAGRRIALAKFANAGQMCVSPDYVLVHSSIKEQLVEQIKKAIEKFFSDKPESDYNYCKIINTKQFDRLIGYLQQGEIIYGGRYDRDKLFIQPTILANVSIENSVMKDEIFGPILPIITFDDPQEAKEIIKRNPNPLAFYLFTSSSKNEKQWMNDVAFGGGCINNASWHLTNHELPFGGRGFSGTGKYHGKFSFDTFSHQKAVMKSPTWWDPAVKYPPFKGRLNLFKWVIR